MGRSFDIKKIRNKVKMAARQFGMQDEWEDIAQEVLTRMLEGRHQHATVDQAVIDYIRKHQGDNRYKTSIKKRALIKAEHQDLDYFDTLASMNPWSKLDALIDSKKCIELIGFDKKAQRAAIYLKYKEDWSQREIADCFGVTETAISLYLGNVERWLRKRLRRKEPGVK